MARTEYAFFSSFSATFRCLKFVDGVPQVADNFPGFADARNYGPMAVSPSGDVLIVGITTVSADPLRGMFFADTGQWVEFSVPKPISLAGNRSVRDIAFMGDDHFAVLFDASNSLYLGKLNRADRTVSWTLASGIISTGDYRITSHEGGNHIILKLSTASAVLRAQRTGDTLALESFTWSGGNPTASHMKFIKDVLAAGYVAATNPPYAFRRFNTSTGATSTSGVTQPASESGTSVPTYGAPSKDNTFFFHRVTSAPNGNMRAYENTAGAPDSQWTPVLRANTNSITAVVAPTVDGDIAVLEDDIVLLATGSTSSSGGRARGLAYDRATYAFSEVPGFAALFPENVAWRRVAVTPPIAPPPPVGSIAAIFGKLQAEFSGEIPVVGELTGAFPKLRWGGLAAIVEPEPAEVVVVYPDTAAFFVDAEPVIPAASVPGPFAYGLLSFPKLSAALAGSQPTEGALSGLFPRLAGDIRAGLVPKFEADFTLPKLSASFEAVVDIHVELDARFPKLEAAVSGVVPSDLAILRVRFPALQADIVSLREEGGFVGAVFPKLSAAIEADRPEGVWLTGQFPSLAFEATGRPNEVVYLGAVFGSLGASAIGGQPVTSEGVAVFPKLSADIRARRQIGGFIEAEFPKLSASVEALGDIGGFVSAEFPALLGDVSARFHYKVDLAGQFPALQFAALPPAPVDADLTILFPKLAAEGRFEQIKEAALDAGFPKLQFAADSERSRRVDANIRFPRLRAAATVFQTVEGDLAASFPKLSLAGSYRVYYAVNIGATFGALSAGVLAKPEYRPSIDAVFPALAAAIESDLLYKVRVEPVFPSLTVAVSARLDYKIAVEASFPRLRFSASTEAAEGGTGDGAHWMAPGDAFNMGGGVIFQTSKTWQIG